MRTRLESVVQDCEGLKVIEFVSCQWRGQNIRRIVIAWRLAHVVVSCFEMLSQEHLLAPVPMFVLNSGSRILLVDAHGKIENRVRVQCRDK